jgi:hypothetical protein
MMPALIRIAGAIQLLIAAANVVLPSKLGYRAGLASAPRMIRQIFYVHAIYIGAILAGFAVFCLAFPDDLAGGSPLGRAVSIALALFWLPRPFLQQLYYDAAVRAQNKLADVGFTLAFAYLAIVFTAAGLTGW